MLTYLAWKDIGVIQSGPGLRPGTFWANLDTEHRLGFTIELMEPLPWTDGRSPGLAEGTLQS